MPYDRLRNYRLEWNNRLLNCTEALNNARGSCVTGRFTLTRVYLEKVFGPFMTWISWATNDIFCLLLSLCILKSFGGQHSREQSNSEAYPPRSMEWFPQPSWQEEGRKLPRGTEKCWQHLLVQCSYTGGVTIHARWYFIWQILPIIFRCR